MWIRWDGVGVRVGSIRLMRDVWCGEGGGLWGSVAFGNDGFYDLSSKAWVKDEESDFILYE